MKQRNNILLYGFLLFLLFIGVFLIFNKNETLLKSVNSLSFPILLFTISTLLFKGNEYVKNKLKEKIFNQRRKAKKCVNKLKDQEHLLTKNENEDETTYVSKLKELKTTAENSKESSSFLISLCDRYIIVHRIAIFVDIISTICFAFCLVVLSGVIRLDINTIWINVISLALVLFDFSIYEELLDIYVNHLFKKVHNLSHKKSCEKG